MIGCFVAWKCLVACRLGEESQQPTWPQVRQSRRCTQGSPVLRHSSQPSALGVTSRMVARWLQLLLMGWLRSVARGAIGVRPIVANFVGDFPLGDSERLPIGPD